MVRPNNRQKVVFETSSYRRDLKRCVRRGWNLKHLKSIVDGLQEGMLMGCKREKCRRIVASLTGYQVFRGIAPGSAMSSLTGY